MGCKELDMTEDKYYYNSPVANSKVSLVNTASCCREAGLCLDSTVRRGLGSSPKMGRRPLLLGRRR